MVPESVIAAVQAELGVTREQLLLPTRSSQRVAWARQIAMHLCRSLHPGASWSEIGRWFGRDRTTVRAAHKKLLEARWRDPALDARVLEVIRVCSAPPV